MVSWSVTIHRLGTNEKHSHVIHWSPDHKHVAGLVRRLLDPLRATYLVECLPHSRRGKERSYMCVFGADCVRVAKIGTPKTYALKDFGGTT